MGEWRRKLAFVSVEIDHCGGVVVLVSKLEFFKIKKGVTLSDSSGVVLFWGVY